MLYLQQSTAVTIKLGPFLDETDGKTAETGLTISQADVRLSKNGGDMAQKNESSSCTHDEIGFYDCSLNATDTGTPGRLLVAVHESGSLPVWAEFMVLSANVYNSLVSGTDYLQVDAVQVEGADATDQVNAACDTAIADASLATAAGLATIDSIADSILSDTGTDGVALSAATCNQIADHTLRRAFASAAASSDGDTKSFRSLLGAVAKLVNKLYQSGGTLYITEADDSTTLGSQAMTTDTNADPTVGLDTN